jgi:type II secretory pathway pseudopilin PulG
MMNRRTTIRRTARSALWCRLPACIEARRLEARTTNCDTARHAFTFLEVLFSVMILGIGMIMVAAMFPAAIKQTQANVEDGSSASIAQLADNTMQLYASSKVVPLGTPPVDTLDLLVAPSDGSTAGTPIVYSFHDQRTGSFTSPATSSAALWQLISPNLVLPNDPQYAWVPLFSRSSLPPGAPPSQAPNKTLVRAFTLYLIPVRCRNRSSGYLGNANGTPNTGSDVAADQNNDPANLDPALVNINFVAATATVPPYLQVVSAYYGANAGQSSPLGGGVNPQFNPIATGAYIVVSNCKLTPSYNGSIFKVGTQVQSTGTGVGTTGEFWSIAPDPLGATVGAAFTADYALVVGRGPDTSSAAYQAWSASSSSMQASPMPRAGVAQDIGIFLTVVALP